MSLFKARRPALILSDVYMPRMNGFKLLLEVKNRVPDLPMLMMTGYSSAAEVLNSSKYRNVSFLAKPFRLSELGERIRSMLGSAS
jgi:DNA-binding NtrC family response regulator